jgi:hypothetical protein
VKQEEEEKENNNRQSDSSVWARPHPAAANDDNHNTNTTPSSSSLRVVSQVLPCNDWPSKSMSCSVTVGSKPSIIQLAPRIKSKTHRQVISTRQHSFMQQRLAMQIDADGDVVMEDAVANVISIDSSFASTVHVKQERNNNGNKRQRNIAMHDENNFTMSTLPLLSLASVASVTRPASISTRRSARQQQQQDMDTDMTLALLLQRDENENADLMYDD